jgi:dolichyl-phosphate beta-glucosyltransferase
MQTSVNPYLSIVIPAYKCADVLEKNLPGFITHLESLNFPFEIIVVDDGSNDADNTRRVAQKYSCSYTANPVNLGKGAAVRRGMLEAKGEYRIFTDGDIPYEYEAIKTMLYYLHEKEFDMVVGDRKLRRSMY